MPRHQRASMIMRVARFAGAPSWETTYYPPMAVDVGGDVDLVLGRHDEARVLLDQLHRALSGASTVVALVGGPDSGALGLARWLVEQRPAHAELEWLIGVRHAAPDLARVAGRVTTLPKLPVVVVTDGRVATDPDADTAFTALVDALDDRREASALVLVVAEDDDGLPAALRDDPRRSCIRLPPLDDDAMFEVLCRAVGGRVEVGFAAVLGQLAAGQPEVARRILRRAVAQGWLERSAEGWRSSRPVAALASLTAEHLVTELRGRDGFAAVVDAASCIGRYGDLAVLRAVADPERPGFEIGLDLAVERELMDADGTRFWFTDAAFRDAWHASLGLRRRQQLHARIAWLLAAREPHHGGSEDDQALLHWTLAGHCPEAAGRRPALLAIAARAEAARRWSTATRALDLAIEDEQATTPAALLVRAGDAHFQLQAPLRAIACYERAARVAEEASDADLRRTARVRALSLRVAHGLPLGDEGIDDGDDEVLAWRLCAQADAHFAAGRPVDGLVACTRADALAVRAGITEVAVRAAVAEGTHHILGLDPTAARAALLRGRRRAEHGPDRLHRIWPHSRLALAEWVAGHESAALDAATSAADIAESERWWAEAALAQSVRAVAAFSCGRVEESVRVARRSLVLARRSNYPFGVLLALPVLVGAGAMTGQPDLLDEAHVAWAATGRMPTVLSALAGAMLGRATDTVPTRAMGQLNLFRAGAAVAATELADWLGDGPLAAAQLPLLQQLLDASVVNVPGWPGSIPRAAAIAARAAGDLRLAVSLTRHARLAAEQSGAEVAAALALYDAGRFGYDGAGIAEMAAAIGRFERLGLVGWVARAQLDVDRHPDARSLSGEQSLRVLVYTDLVGSTEVNVRTGDRRFVELLAVHQAEIDASAAAHRGVRFHNTGDGFGIWFTTAADALACAQDIGRRLTRATAHAPGGRLVVRVGVAAGRPVPFDGDLYGLAVVRAARVCARAGPDEVLVAGEVLELEPRAPERAQFVESVVLKGFAEPTPLYRLERKG